MWIEGLNFIKEKIEGLNLFFCFFKKNEGLNLLKNYNKPQNQNIIL